jgi:hypothetical protein
MSAGFPRRDKVPFDHGPVFLDPSQLVTDLACEWRRPTLPGAFGWADFFESLDDPATPSRART